MIHFANLTRGLLCTHLCDVTLNPHITRIPSTWLEQHLWDQVLWGAGPDLYYWLAIGQPCVIHDVSERARETRACWQGIPWIRYACERAWQVPTSPVTLRGGYNAEQYFHEMYDGLGVRTTSMLGHFRQYHEGTLVDLRSCWQKELR